MQVPFARRFSGALAVLSVGSHSSCFPDFPDPAADAFGAASQEAAPQVESEVVERLGVEHAPKAAGHPIEVYRTKPPEKPFDEVGTIRATVAALPDEAETREVLLEALKNLARQLGGDGLANLDESAATEVTGINEGVVGIEKRTLTAVAIRFQDSSD